MATTEQLRHYGHEALDLAASMEADLNLNGDDPVVRLRLVELRRTGEHLLVDAAARDAIDALLAEQGPPRDPQPYRRVGVVG